MHGGTGTNASDGGTTREPPTRVTAGATVPRVAPMRAALTMHPNRRPVVREDFDDIEDFDDATEAWDERWEAVMFAPERTVGAIVISHLGCAQREWLIISGSNRGTIWSDCRVDDVDLAPLLDDDSAPVTFARWYTDWLEKAERTALSAL